MEVLRTTNNFTHAKLICDALTDAFDRFNFQTIQGRGDRWIVVTNDVTPRIASDMQWFAIGFHAALKAHKEL